MNVPVFPTRKYHVVYVSDHQIKEADIECRSAEIVKQIIKGQDPLALIKMIVTGKDLN